MNTPPLPMPAQTQVMSRSALFELLKQESSLEKSVANLRETKKVKSQLNPYRKKQNALKNILESLESESGFSTIP